MAKIELPESWAGVAEPLRALMAEVERETHADNTTPDLAAVSARWAQQVSDAIRTMVRARIADAQAAQELKMDGHLMNLASTQATTAAASRARDADDHPSLGGCFRRRIVRSHDKGNEVMRLLLDCG